MQKRFRKNSNLDLKTALIVLVLLLVAIAAGIAWVTRSQSDSEDVWDTTPPNTINYDPPTKKEQSAGDQQKEEIVADQGQEIKENSEQASKADVVIVDARQYDQEIEVRAFVSNVIADGICTITFTKNDMSFSEQVPASADASTSPCIALTLERSRFSDGGNWKVEVNYASSDGSYSGNAYSTIEIE